MVLLVVVVAKATIAGSVHFFAAASTCCTYIQGHTHSTIKLSDLSELTGMSTRRLSLHFREEVGMTIGEYTHRAKINEAKILLHYTDHSISEVATYLGFCTQSHFTQVFKEITGLNPMEYKKRFDTDAYSVPYE